MSASAVPDRQSRSTWPIDPTRARGLLVAIAVLAALFLVVAAITPGAFSYFELTTLSTGGATLALAAIGQTLVILTGGFDLSAGAAISLVNVVLASCMGPSVASQLAMGVAALALGGAIGAFNGLFVAFVRLQPIVVTLSSMFIVQGITLLIQPTPGGAIAPGFSAFLTGEAVPGILPAPVAVVAASLAVWLLIRNSRFGVSIFAVGSDPDAAHAAGIPTRATLFFSYVAAGMFYGAAGAFVSAQTGSADPLVGRPMLLEVFTAVVLGGTALGGGRGGAAGSVVGAYILMIVVNILLVLNVPAYYGSVAEGAILVLAVLAGSLNRHSPAAAYLRLARLSIRARRARTRVAPGHAPLRPPPPPAVNSLPAVSWLQRHRGSLRLVLPAYGGFVLVLVATQAVLGHVLSGWGYFNSLLVLSSFLAILALGQGAVILTGGLDLSLPWMIGLVGILTSGLIGGSDVRALWVVPTGLLLGTALGALNGAGIVFLGLPPIVMTLAMNGILQGAALVYSGGTPAGFAAPAERWIMTGRLGGATPIVWLLALFVPASLLLLTRTAFGRRIYAVGNSAVAATFSGVGVGRVLIGVYALSGFCAALVGILLSGFSGQASLGMGDDTLLPSIAAVVVGGTLITGGRGHYLGMLGGVLILTALSTLLEGTMLPSAVREIIFGLVVLGAVLALRERAR